VLISPSPLAVVVVALSPRSPGHARHRFLSAVLVDGLFPSIRGHTASESIFYQATHKRGHAALLFDLRGCEVPHHGVNLDAEPGVEQRILCQPEQSEGQQDKGLFGLTGCSLSGWHSRPG